ncbi:MAG TPA: (Fe-S)-binding protein [Desulfobaccales bacterium]|nr:(Fe-S)-binding protein [Desulfobaccales bacterium]
MKLFIPCFLDQCAPQAASAVAGLLDRLNVAWQYPEDQTCCGQFAWTAGDPATARRLMRHFLRVFAGAETILCPSASCTYMVRHCYPQLAEGRRESRAVAAVAARVMELSEWLYARGPLPWTPEFEGSLVLHQSCKARQLGVLDGAREVLSQVKGLELLTISPYYTCCGFGGTFALQHPEISRDIGEAYLAAVSATGAAGLVSLDYSCLLHLQGLGRAPARDLKFYHLAEIMIGPEKPSSPV